MKPVFEVDMKDFQNAMKQYMVDSGKTAREVLALQAQKLITSKATDPDDGIKRGGLYEECRNERFATIDEIKSLPSKLGYRIKTWRFAGKGMTKAKQIKKEIKRRLKHTGYVQSTGWLNRVWSIRGKGSARVPKLRLVGKPRGRVIQNLSGNNPSIEIINETPGAQEFANKTGYLRRALANRSQDMAKYLKTKMLLAAKKAGLKVA